MVPAGVALWIDGILLVIGAVLALVMGTLWAAAILRATPGLEGVNGGWLIPPVMNLLVPLALAPLIIANPSAAPVLVLVGFAFYGIGILLFIAMLTLLVARLALRDPLPAGMAPSLWIPLAPAGMMGLALLRLEQAAEGAGVPGFTGTTAGLVVAAMGIGFGLWWAVFAGLELRRIRAAGGPPVHPGWWGFVFPIGAMTLSIAAVGAVTGHHRGPGRRRRRHRPPRPRLGSGRGTHGAHGPGATARAGVASRAATSHHLSHGTDP